MKFTLGMIVKNEEFFLEKTMPLIAPCFDEIVAVDAESTDRTRDILASYKAKIVVRPWTYNYSEARNEAIKHATGDWMLMLDADEAMFPHFIHRLRTRCAAMREPKLVLLPRLEFVQDFDHYDDAYFPDYQGRAFCLRFPYEYRNKIHEIVYRKGEVPCEWELKRFITYNDCLIYHYGQCKPREVTWLRHHNYGLIQRGETPLTVVPPEAKILPYAGMRKFTENHPLKGQPK
jgi:glycosyltransferase involved in cell wall biosynthesis